MYVDLSNFKKIQYKYFIFYKHNFYVNTVLKITFSTSLDRDLSLHSFVIVTPCSL